MRRRRSDPTKTDSGSPGLVCETVSAAVPEDNVATTTTTTTPTPPEYPCIARFELSPGCVEFEQNVKGLIVTGAGADPGEVRVTGASGCAGGALARAVFATAPAGSGWEVAVSDHTFCVVGDDNQQLVCDVSLAVQEPWIVELPQLGGACPDHGTVTFEFILQDTPECVGP
jgi:hypothetical protein